MIKHGSVNPLNVFGLRETYYCPPHFDKVIFDADIPITDIRHWIYERFDDRFFLGKIYAKRDSARLCSRDCAAFENYGEATIFRLSLSDVNRLKL